jgi:hypothetical protein
MLRPDNVGRDEPISTFLAITGYEKLIEFAFTTAAEMLPASSPT